MKIGTNTYGYVDLLEPTLKQKLAEHVEMHPNDGQAAIVLHLYERIEALEAMVASHEPLLMPNRMIG